MEKEEIVRQLSQKADNAWNTYVDELLKLSPSVLISRADEISAANLCYEQLKNCESYPTHLLEHMLQYDDPLKATREQWIEEAPEPSPDFEHVMWSLWNYGPDPEDGPDQGGIGMG